MSYKIIKEAFVSPGFATGAIKHYTGFQKMSVPTWVQIIQCDDSYYLLYLDENKEEMNDTFHDTLEQALKQAQREFGELNWVDYNN